MIAQAGFQNTSHARICIHPTCRCCRRYIPVIEDLEVNVASKQMDLASEVGPFRFTFKVGLTTHSEHLSRRRHGSAAHAAELKLYCESHCPPHLWKPVTLPRLLLQGNVLSWDQAANQMVFDFSQLVVTLFGQQVGFAMDGLGEGRTCRPHRQAELVAVVSQRAARGLRGHQKGG